MWPQDGAELDDDEFQHWLKRTREAQILLHSVEQGNEEIMIYHDLPVDGTGQSNLTKHSGETSLEENRDPTLRYSIDIYLSINRYT